jgi:uncharacterized membrane protein YraQ (UPF0718 family)
VAGKPHAKGMRGTAAYDRQVAVLAFPRKLAAALPERPTIGLQHESLELTTPLIALAFFLATLLGALPPVLRRWGDRSLHLFIALSAGLFLGTVFLHILPELGLLGAGGEHAGHDHATGSGGRLVPWTAALVGFLGLFLLEKVWLRGYQERDARDPHQLVWVSTYIALSLHALAGGMGLAVIDAKWVVLLPVLWHKLTESFSLTTVLRLAGVRSGGSWLLVVLFALATPAGYFAGDSLLQLGTETEAILIGLAGGTFIYVAACDLLPEVFHNVGQPAPRVFALVLGILAAGIFPHHATSDLGTGFFSELLVASWEVFVQMSPYLVFGFLIAGLLSQWLDPERLSRWIARDNLRSVGVASVVGAPLPLCSCSVVPVAASLRKAGAGKGATSAFLVATPETGVDSISVTYGLLDPLMAIVRPLASVASAVLVGLSVNAFVRSGKDDEPQAGLEEETPVDCCADESASGDEENPVPVPTPGGGFLTRAMRYAFVDMLDDLAGALVVGIFLSGLIAVLIPESAFDSALLQGPGGIFLMLLIGVPIYVCAAASTPIAATLILKGLSPGAALVFLLAGPATNIATLSVMTRYLGKRVVMLHVIALALVTLAFGFLVDGLYGWLDMTPSATLAAEHGGPAEVAMLAIAGTFALLLVASLWRKFAGAEEEDESCGEAHGHG